MPESKDCESLPIIIWAWEIKIYGSSNGTTPLVFESSSTPLYRREARAMSSEPPKITVGPFHFTSVGVRVTGKPGLPEWNGPLHFALWCQRAGPWWIGDLLNAGEDAFAESFSQMCEGAVSAEMLNRYASVARRVPIENRVPSLSWSAHAAVARLPADLQKRLLLDAERHGWSSAELQTKARESVTRASE